MRCIGLLTVALFASGLCPLALWAHPHTDSAPAGTNPVGSPPVGTPSAGSRAEGQTRQSLLAAHNEERGLLGIAPLRWNKVLEREAQEWAQYLAWRDTLQHSSYEQRNGTGENLWVGTRGFYSPREMFEAFTRKKHEFKPGVFPDVSRTGNWADVGHYSQLIWPGTREVGCAIMNNARLDYLVCRYWPAGNVIGAFVGQSHKAIARRHRAP